MSDATLYRHRPLRYPDAIRLCRILPHSDTASSIQICLAAYRLSDPKLDFTALSYTWGDPTDKVLIPVGGRGVFLPVPRSAVEALTMLRLHGKTQLFWIDAICIDQDASREKTIQVRMMDRIFATATCTTIYLGPHTESSKIVFQELLEALHGPKAIRYGRPWAVRDRPNDVVIQGVETLIQRPWFRRVWVLQEALLGQDIQILCGDSMAPLDILFQCFVGYSDTRVIKLAIPIAFRPDILKTISYSVLWHNLWECFYWTRDCLASDARDRLFALKALLGMSENKAADAYMADFDKLINYESHLEDIFTSLSMILLQCIGLRLLTGVKHGHSRKMPSWVPDWSQNLPLNRQYFQYENYIAESLQSIDRMTSRLYSNPDPRLLSVQGWRCGEIHEMGRAYSFDNFEDAQHQISHLVNLISAQELRGTIQADDSELIEAGVTIGIMKAFRQIGTSRIEEFLISSDSRRLSVEGLIANDTETHELIDCIIETIQGCRLVLCGPLYIAIAPRSAKIGDILVVIEGAHAPCLLRPTSEDTWSLIRGDCCTLSLDSSNPFDGYCDEENAESLRDEWGQPEHFLLS